MPGRNPLTSLSSSHLSLSNSYTSLGKRFAVGSRDVASGPAPGDAQEPETGPREEGALHPRLLSARALGWPWEGAWLGPS